jgi:thymidylate synthase
LTNKLVAQIELAKCIVIEINKKANTDFRIENVTSISISAHIYQSDFEIVKRVLEKYYYKMIL